MPPKHRVEVDPEITAATSAEISRLITEFEAKRRAVSDELAAIYQARIAGAPVEVVPPANVTEARKLAATMLNGNAPPDFLRQFPERTREAELELQKEAIGIVISTLSRDAIRVRTAEAVAFREQHIDRWCELWREALLTREKLIGLQAAIVGMRKEARFADLPLADWDNLIFDEDTSLASFDRCINEAIALDIVARGDLEHARKIRE